jgi:hypothetical protein
VRAKSTVQSAMLSNYSLTKSFNFTASGVTHTP